MAVRKVKKKERTVKRKSVVQQRQADNKAKFIAKLREMPIIQVAAAQIGIHRDTYYEWSRTDSAFKQSCLDALRVGNDFVSDMAESMMVKKIKDGNMTSIIFWLKNHHPQYNDKRYHEHEHYFREDLPLTEERKEEILRAMKAWNEPDTAEDDDDRPEDYEVKDEEEERPKGPRYDDEGNLIP